MNGFPEWRESPAPPVEIWGGVECSVVRTPGGRYDQLERTGHAEREDDLDRFAALGLRTLRYPILWERHEGEPIDWRWADRRLRRLRELGIRPIVGLLHHGCGPLPDGFLDPGFVPGLAAFARAVARRYPWIDAYTPINEPLTTARFSGLYGLWHPFRADPASFAQIFLVQCEAIRAAMAAVREVNPAAQLIQTEDVGKTHATAALAYQADFENERRWLTFDCLNGLLGPEARLWPSLRDSGVPEAALESFRENPCPPDILGMNHYVTGERMLDEQLESYPPHLHGGNGRDRYVDVPAVRVRREGLLGGAALLHELWERYRRPVAITEVQLACTRDEQLRWLAEMWGGAREARRQGVDVRAVTAWALMGAWDWDTLLLEQRGSYESGAFDVQVQEPRMTALGCAIRSLATEGSFDHPVLAAPGWWRRPTRLLFSPVSTLSDTGGTAVTEAGMESGQALLLVGADEALAATFHALCSARGLRLRSIERAVLLDPHGADSLRDDGPWAVILIDHSDGRLRQNVTAVSPADRRLLTSLRLMCQQWDVPLVFFPEIPSATVGESGDLARMVHALLDKLIDESAHFLMARLEAKLAI